MARTKPSQGARRPSVQAPRKAQQQSPALRSSDLALIGVGLTVFLLALGALIAVGLASSLLGRGWLWPSGGVAGAAHELGALLTGRLHDRRLPGPVALWFVVVVVELVVLATGIAFVRWAGQVVRPTRADAKLASRDEVSAALGRKRRPLRAFLHRIAPQLPVAESAPSWPLGRAQRVDLRVPFGQTVGVLGPAGAGKTLDVVAHAELAAPGALIQASSKPDDVLLTLTRRGEPVAVFDPLGAVPGLPPLTWDPLNSCVDSTVATRRAKAFCAGTVLGASLDGGDPATARANAAQAAKVLQCYLHAAALTGRTVDHVLTWVADPAASDVAEKILREHPHAEPHWADLLHGALRAGAPTATLQQAMDALLHKEITTRCRPTARHPGTDLAGLLARGGTVYLLGRDDAVVSLSPLLTAVADDAIAAAPSGTVVVLDDLPTVPVPTLPTGLVWSAPSRSRLAVCYGEDTARAAVDAADVLVHVGPAAAQELARAGAERPLRDGEAVVVVGDGAPFVVRLNRVVDGKAGAGLRAQLDQARARAAAPADRPWYSRGDPTRSALAAAHERGLHPDSWRST
jgi:type IV secretion system protein VirD4